LNGSISVRFTEEMKGYVSFGEEDYERGAKEGRQDNTRLMFHLTIEVEDLDLFEADREHEAKAAGWVVCHPLGGQLSVETGIFNLLVGKEDPAIQHMLYRLFFRDGVGHPVTMAGFKVMRSHPPTYVWSDTTTLYTRLLRGHVEAKDEPAAEVVASGILRLRPLGFLRQLATFRAEGPSRITRIAALGRFDALFLGQLWRIYGWRVLRGIRGSGRRSERPAHGPDRNEAGNVR
jgi:hypothetical protein